MVELRVLGAVDLRDGEGLSLQSVLTQPKRIALLTYFAASRPAGTHRRDTLLALFWPESSEESARNSLNQAVHALRRSLGQEALVSYGHEQIGLDPQYLWCDAARFQEFLDVGELEAALELYRGDLLEGFHISATPLFEEWLARERTRLRQRAATAALALSERAAEQGRISSAVEWARRAHALAPHDENSLRKLIVLLHRSSGRAGALKAYDDFAARLWAELEITPTEETQALVTRIREGLSPKESKQAETALAAAPSEMPVSDGPTREKSRPDELMHLAGDAAPAGEESPPTLRPSSGRAAVYIAVGLLLLVVLIGVSQGFRSQDPQLPGQDRIAASTVEKSIAVLPFDNLSESRDNQYFSDGITDDILTHLSKINDLRVISRNSVRKYKDTDEDVEVIAKELGATHVLSGSVRRTGNRVRITAQLVDARTDQHLWAETYDRELQDVFAVQSDIAQQIASVLAVQLTGGERERITAAPTRDIAAYDEYLRGRQLLLRHTESDNEAAIRLFQRALARDPSFALAYADLGYAYVQKAGRFGADVTWGDSAIAMSEKAIALSPDLADGYGALAQAHSQLGRYSRALDAATRALALYPNLDPTMNAVGNAYRSLGRLDEAVHWFLRAQRINPHQPVIPSNLAAMFLVLDDLPNATRYAARTAQLAPGPHIASIYLAIRRGQYAEAVRFSREHVSRFPDQPESYLIAGDAHLFASDPEGALRYLERGWAMSPSTRKMNETAHHIAAVLGYALIETGNEARARRVFATFKREAQDRLAREDESFELRYNLAAVAAMEGRKADAYAWLQQAIKAGWRAEVFGRNDFLFQGLHQEPRFQQMMAHVKADVDQMRANLDRDGG